MGNNEFLTWFAANYDEMRRLARKYDDDVFSDTMLLVNEAVEKYAIVPEAWRSYFLKALKNNNIGAAKKASRKDGNADVENLPLRGEDSEDCPQIVLVSDDPRADRSHATLLYEIYLGLCCPISTREFARIFGFCEQRIANRFTRIKKRIIAKNPSVGVTKSDKIILRV